MPGNAAFGRGEQAVRAGGVTSGRRAQQWMAHVPCSMANGRKPKERYQWTGQWEAHDGTVAWYSLRYDATVDSLGIVKAQGSLRVAGTLLSAKRLRAMRRQ